MLPEVSTPRPNIPSSQPSSSVILNSPLPIFPTSSDHLQPSKLFKVPSTTVPTSSRTEQRLFFLPDFSKKYQDFKGSTLTLKELLRWIKKESKGVVFEHIRCAKWPDLENGLRKEDVEKCITPILTNFEAVFGKDHPLYPKLINIFFQLYSLLLCDQKAETELVSQQVTTYLFGFHANGTKTIMYPDQVVIAFNHHADFFDLTYSKNLGQRSGFSTFRTPQYGGDFENVFLAPDNSRLNPYRFAFAVVDFSLIPPESRDIYVQNKLLALQDTINKQRGGYFPPDIIGGVVLIRGVPSPGVLNWLIQRNVQEIPRFPNVEVIAWLDLDVSMGAKGRKETCVAPYLITIKAASSFRWKKDNFNRIMHPPIAKIFFGGKPLTGSEKRELKNKYSAAKDLIKNNLKWTPAHEIFIKMAQSIGDNQNFSQIFWCLVREKEGHSGLPAIPLAKFGRENEIMRNKEIDFYLFTEIKRFVSWLVDMANDNPENVPESVRVPLRKETAIKRLEKIERKYGGENLAQRSSEGAEKRYLFPGDEIVKIICENFKPIFIELLSENELIHLTGRQIYRLPIAPIIGDFLAEHLTLETLKTQKNRIRELAALSPKDLELDSKDQTNYSLQQVFYCLRLSPTQQLIQASDHIVTRENYETIESLAQEYENCLLYSYAMCIFCFQKEETALPAHIQAMSNLSDKLLAFGRGKNFYTLWSKFFKHFKEEKITNLSTTEVNKIFTTKLSRLKKDTEVTSLEKLAEYYAILYSAFALNNMPLEHLKQFIHNHANNSYTTKVADFKRIMPGLYDLLSRNRPLKELPKLKELFLPIFFENISPDFLPVGDDDRVITLTFPPAEIRTHWVKYIYIVDSENKVKIFPEMTSGKRKGMRISHSQLANWGPVRAAGEVYFAKINNQWCCVQINNGSGHYEPDAEGSLQTAKEAIMAALSTSEILYDRTTGIPVRNVLLPGVPAHSFLNDTNGI